MNISQNIAPDSPTEAAWPTEAGFGIACRCGLTILVEVQISGEIDPDQLTDVAITCDACGASHWATPARVHGT